MELIRIFNVTSDNIVVRTKLLLFYLFWFFIGEVNCDCDCDCDWDFVLDCVCEGEVVDNEEDGEITSETRPTVVVNEIPSIWQITLYK